MKKSMVDFVDSQSEVGFDVDKAVKTILQQKDEKMVRYGIVTPESLHKQLKKIAIDEGINLKDFFLQAVLEKCERMNYKIEK